MSEQQPEISIPDDNERLQQSLSELAEKNRALEQEIAERKRAERALCDKAQYLELAVDSGHLGIWNWNIGDDTVVWNDRMFELYGLARETSGTGMEWWLKAVHPDDRGMTMEAFQAAVRGEKVFDIEFRAVCPDETVRYIKADGLVVRDADGRAERMIGLNRDITQSTLIEEVQNVTNQELAARREEAEDALEALSRAEEKLRLLLDSTAEAIYGIDTDGNCTFCNSACLRMLGYRHQDELIGMNMHWMIHHHRQDGASLPIEECRIFRAFNEQEGTHADDEVLWRADGTCFPVEYWSYPQHSDGKIVGAVVTFVDITERVRSQEKLLKLSRAVENSPATVVITDREGWIEYVNPKFSEISGYSAEEAIGRNPRLLNAGLQQPEFYKKLWETILGGSEWRGEFCNKKKNGDIHWEHASISPIRDDKGFISHFVAVKEDVTERKWAAEELKRAKEAADTASRSKSQFLANMSHEIRTPLNAIIGFSTILHKTDLSGKQHDYMHKIIAAGQSLLRLINDILDFSKIEAGMLEMESIGFALDDVLSNVTNLVQQKAAEKRIEFLINCSDNIPPRLNGDPLRLGQLLSNLLGNAIKFTEKGEVELIVNLLSRDDNRVKLLFSVRDTGIGMTPDQCKRLFQPFSQADGTMTRKYGGTGLGLSICKRIVDIMGGNIWVESGIGTGSVFNITVWLDYEGAIETQQSVPVPLNGGRVLVVDDSATSRKMLAKLLAPLPVRVDVVSSGIEALESVMRNDASDPYQLVLMDWQMPGMDGIEATRRIKSELELHSTPAVIIVTSFGGDAEHTLAQDAGADEFLHKPFTTSSIVEAMFRIFTSEAPTACEKAISARESMKTFSASRVLLVEDDDINRQIAMELLEYSGFTVETASDGSEALEMVTRGGNPFDLVLMDVEMPVMDGYEATRLIRADGRFAALPIIAMTAHAMVEEKQKTLEAGMNDHITKPIDLQEMFATIGRHLHKISSGVQPVRFGVDDPVAGTVSIPEITCVDISGALERLGNDGKLYLWLVENFIENKTETAGLIEQALNCGDQKLAARLVHTVKGLAGNIGADGLEGLATELESSIVNKQPQEMTFTLLKRFAAEMADLVSSLKEILPALKSENPDDPAGEIDTTMIRSVLVRLLRYIEENDGEAEDFLNERRKEMAGVCTENLGRLGMYLSKYDYASSREIIDEIARNMGISLVPWDGEDNND